MTSLENIR